MIKRSGNGRVTFALPSNHVHGAVSVVGDFNNWDPWRHPLKRRSNGTHSVMIDLTDRGAHHYRFRYLDTDGHFFDDDDADTIEPNGLGETHSVLTL
jgi:1,4-alpha-glucan branching enzyme